MRNKFLLSVLAILLVESFIYYGCNSNTTEAMEKQLREFIAKFEAVYVPLEKEANLASFNASMSGDDKAYNLSAELNMQLQAVFTDKAHYVELKKIKDSELVKDSILAREMKVLYNAYLGGQVDTGILNQIIKLQNEVEKKFSTFRPEINDKKYTDNQIDSILQTSKKTDEVKAAWLASKKIGNVVSDDVRKLAKLRNELAKQLGFKNYQDMSMTLSEQDPVQIEKLFDELDNLTRDVFAKQKDEIDTYFAKYYGINKADLMPWHYQNRFFQEAPKIYPVDLDGYYKDQDIVELAKKFYTGIGLPIEPILANSDLFERDKKYQHAYCTDIDRNGDVRIVCNITKTERWMGTTLHEAGHAVYSYNMDRNVLPFMLRESAHTFTTEAIAQIMGRLATNPAWLRDVVGISEAEKKKIEEFTFKSLKLQQLAFSRWAQVMYRFEKGMYENPDQDLNKLWWDLVEKYQMLKRPADRNEPDWASKIHIASYPCYYHNYLLGELLASQLFYYISDNILKTNDYTNVSFAGKKEVGEYLKKNIFEVGKRYYWDEMIKRATGENLTPKYYAKQFVN